MNQQNEVRIHEAFQKWANTTKSEDNLYADWDSFRAGWIEARIYDAKNQREIDERRRKYLEASPWLIASLKKEAKAPVSRPAETESKEWGDG